MVVFAPFSLLRHHDAERPFAPRNKDTPDVMHRQETQCSVFASKFRGFTQQAQTFSLRYGM